MFGALMIVGAGAFIGRLQARRLQDRSAEIRRFIRILGLLETEISYGVTPLPEALLRIAKRSVPPLAGMLESIGTKLAADDQAVMDVWQQTMYREWSQTAMRAAEKEIILQLGFTLGTTDREDQIKHLRLASKQLESVELEALEDQRKYEKLWKSLGLLGGALIAVIMY